MTGNRPFHIIIEPIKAAFSEHIKEISFFIPCKYLNSLCHQCESPFKHLFNPSNRPYFSLFLYYLVLFHSKLDLIADFLGLRAEHEVGVREVEVAQLGPLDRDKLYLRESLEGWVQLLGEGVVFKGFRVTEEGVWVREKRIEEVILLYFTHEELS
jgi:hypothetical protein